MTMQHPSPTPARPLSTPSWILPGQRVLRACVRMLGAASPVHAAKVMDHLWFSAPRTRPRASEQAVLDGGHRLSFEVHGRPVAAWGWGDEGPAVILVHGWGGHAAQLQSFVQPLREAGFRVIAFDAPSHGASAASRHGGRRVTFFEFAAALQAIASAEARVSGVIAHSGGCTAVSLALREGWTPPPNLVFVAPFVRPAAAIEGFAHAIGANERVVAEFGKGVERWLGHPWSYLDITSLDHAHRRQRLLVIHDEDDKEVPLAHAQALTASWPSSEMLATKGLGHRRVLRDPGVVKRALDFLVAGSAELPAQATSYLPRDSRAALDAAYEACVFHGTQGRIRAS